jgi:hypothetical protein
VPYTARIPPIKRRGFLRYVCVALRNVGDSSDLPAPERAAADPEPLIAEHATWAIQQIHNRQKAFSVARMARVAVRDAPLQLRHNRQCKIVPIAGFVACLIIVAAGGES